MARSHEYEIDYFKSLTNWTNEQTIIDFLEMCEWNLETAAEVFLTAPNENKNDPTGPPILRRMISRETGSFSKLMHQRSVEQLIPNDNHTHQQHQSSTFSSVESSPHLCNSSNHSQTTNNSSHSPNTSNRTSFLEHVDLLLVSDVNTTSPVFHTINQFDNNKQQLIQYIDSNVIGKDLPIDTPWGTRKLIYADYTASGRGLTFIEYYMLNNVLPYYANTHSENNACALQTTKFREGSRTLIKKCVNATDDDVVIFTGSGSTAAVNKLVDVLRLRDENIRNTTVVFISTFEHHSNILPWKETGVEIVRIPNTKQGLLDRDDLKKQLEHYHNNVKKHIICTFNAASNVTGIRTDVDTVSTLVHEYHGWIFWDYAAAAPYVNIDMNPSKTAYKDAVFISTHKFVGGPSTPGVLIAKKKLFTNQVPSNCGGGTVNYVTRTHTEYVQDIETREEGGTPNILGSIRGGLVFHLKQAVGSQLIELREDKLVDKMFQRFRNHKTLYILGSTAVPRLAIFSFLIYVESANKYLHHNFICVLLNDLFGIQVRSGCSCAGPYVLDLLNIDDEKAEIYTKFFTEDASNQMDSIPRNALMKPGFTRFNLSYFASDEEVDYILDALDFIANHGWKFLPLYTYNPETAVWRPRDMQPESLSTQFHCLQMITYENGAMEENVQAHENQLLNSSVPQSIVTSSSNNPIEQAESMAMNIPKYVFENVDFRSDPPLNIPDEYQEFIWFVTPKQIIRKMVIEFEENQQKHRIPVPFHPRSNDQ